MSRRDRLLTVLLRRYVRRERTPPMDLLAGLVEEGVVVDYTADPRNLDLLRVNINIPYDYNTKD